MIIVVAAFVFSIIGSFLAFDPARAGSASMWVAFGAAQLPLTALAAIRLKKTGELREILQPKWGDMSLGVGSGLLLLVMAWGASKAITPMGSKQQAWLMRVYLQAGDPEEIQRRWLPLFAAIVAITLCEELVWRGLVLPLLEEKFGTRIAWVMTAVIYGLSFLPSVWMLRDGAAGPNPLIVAIALLGGFIWTYLSVRTARIVPSVLSHAVFVWFVVAQFRLFTIGGM